MLAFHMHIYRYVHLSRRGHVPTQATAAIENGADCTDILRICCVYKFIAAIQHGWNVSDHQVNDDTVHHCSADLFLPAGIFHQSEAYSRKFLSLVTADLYIATGWENADW